MSTPTTPSSPSAESTPASASAPAEGAATDTVASEPSTPAAPPSRYSLGTFPNMFRSMFVIGLFVLALVAIVPRITQVQRPAVDAAGKASQVAALTTWPVELPRGLGQGWVPTVATYAPGTEKVPTFTTVWTTPSGADIALKQAVGATQGWVARSVNDGSAAGTATVKSRAFERFVASDKGQIAYVVKGQGAKGLTLVAGGTAPEDELKAFVAALAPVTPAPGVSPAPAASSGATG
ncbi:DUF4245 domain-containing protein [Terrabacter carboxydivorans]|uniref:DUF4245 domain-containing protein n=1 Tax=Terrabacter carboxydivorans TaxID=619730 RepID=A0ABN3LE81_9MICO